MGRNAMSIETFEEMKSLLGGNKDNNIIEVDEKTIIRKLRFMRVFCGSYGHGFKYFEKTNKLYISVKGYGVKKIVFEIKEPHQ